MSWILHPEGDGGGRAKLPTKLPRVPPGNGSEAPAGGQPSAPAPGSPATDFPMRDEYPKVPDPVDADRLVSTKHANRPFLSHAAYRAQREKEHQGWLQRKKEREEKLARGEEVGPEEHDPTEEPEVGCLGLLKFLFYSAIFIILAGKFITGSFLWEHELPDLRRYIPTNDRLFSEGMLAQFDGSNPEKPLYIAIDGDVYDVSSNRATYGPGGSYHFMAGRDAARAYGTGCFATHRTHDLRGLTEKEMQGVQHWKKFFAEHKKYFKVGRVSHPPIDPSSPIPEHCDPKKAQAAKDAEEKAVREQRKEDDPGTKREEL
ncbi:cytochrome b5 [Obba rivulosa]|uniref:Cytochrome b5 n=1 Tax=Obba rivulosa TaxID=1052685 RepID=A0A8E2DTW0_9APHY|nr:cytochrome b5 [Obba rivulosa]